MAEYSCAGVKNLYNSGSDNGDSIVCWAANSCAHSSLAGAADPTNYYFFASFSGYNSTIDTLNMQNNGYNVSHNINITMSTFYSGYGSAIKYKEGADCKVRFINLCKFTPSHEKKKEKFKHSASIQVC